MAKVEELQTMSTQDLIDAQENLAFSNKDLAALLCCSATHVSNLRRGYKTKSGENIPVLPTKKDARILQQAVAASSRCCAGIAEIEQLHAKFSTILSGIINAIDKKS